MRLSFRLLLLIAALFTSVTFAAPPLPTGLSLPASSKPTLPEGLFKAPSLPSGIDSAEPKKNGQNNQSPFKSDPSFNLSGFLDFRSGTRTQHDPNESQPSLNEARLQLSLQKEIASSLINLTGDFLADTISSQHAIDLDNGQGWIDLREANMVLSPFTFVDVKLGRQVLTWGTGDLIFINDLFPKDWQAFFIGRDLEYLKAPSDAVKVSFFSNVTNLDLVYTPRFDADRGITGEKLSYYNPALNSLVGDQHIVNAKKPHADEISIRLYKNIATSEVALYAYHGFWKNPVGFNPLNNTNRYPLMRSIGASIRTPLGHGIGNIEIGYYDSYEQGARNNPFTPNSEARLLMGYEQELVKNLSIGVQYYAEWMQDYRDYKTSMAQIGATEKRDEIRHVITNRLRLLTHQQNITWSLFTFYSPSDADAYIRPNINYQYDDHWSLEAGGHFFMAQEKSTFFGQFKKNNNIYASVRYGF
ncbi:MAG: hypothetical protein ACPG4B_00835 [Cycloclasticus sp.]